MCILTTCVLAIEFGIGTGSTGSNLYNICNFDVKNIVGYKMKLVVFSFCHHPTVHTNTVSTVWSHGTIKLVKYERKTTSNVYLWIGCSYWWRNRWLCLACKPISGVIKVPHLYRLTHFLDNPAFTWLRFVKQSSEKWALHNTEEAVAVHFARLVCTNLVHCLAKLLSFGHSYSWLSFRLQEAATQRLGIF